MFDFNDHPLVFFRAVGQQQQTYVRKEWSRKWVENALNLPPHRVNWLFACEFVQQPLWQRHAKWIALFFARTSGINFNHFISHDHDMRERGEVKLQRKGKVNCKCVTKKKYLSFSIFIQLTTKISNNLFGSFYFSLFIIIINIFRGWAARKRPSCCCCCVLHFVNKTVCMDRSFDPRMFTCARSLMHKFQFSTERLLCHNI